MEDLASVLGAIGGAGDPVVLLRRVVDEAVALIPAADGAGVELIDEDHVTSVCANGTLSGYVGTRLRLEHALCGAAPLAGEILNCEDCETDPRVNLEACRQLGIASMVCVPLWRGNGPMGVLTVSAGCPRTFTAEDVSLLSRLGNFISAAISAASEIARTATDLFDAARLPSQTADPDAGTDPNPAQSDPEIGEFVAKVLRPGLEDDSEIRQRLAHVLADASLRVVCQPIVNLETNELVGLEALARFPRPLRQTTEAWFKEAERVGLGVTLQLTAVKAALSLLDDIPHPAFLAINVGPDALVNDELYGLLEAADASRIVIELTEHLKIDDYLHLRRVLQRIRSLGPRLAIDDTGAGFASLSHVVNLAPDLIKLDHQLTQGVDLEPDRRALAHSLSRFATEIGAKVIAEGLENAGEVHTVRQLGIRYGQGYFISRPAPLDAILRQFPQSAAIPRGVNQGLRLGGQPTSSRY